MVVEAKNAAVGTCQAKEVKSLVSTLAKQLLVEKRIANLAAESFE